jgi:WhiB family redox-sensing transcriptional regulator
VTSQHQPSSTIPPQRGSIGAAHHDWQQHGACLTGDPDLFFPVSTGGPGQKRAEQARRICRGCPVQAACLDWAIDIGITDGIWGGLDETQRRALQRQRRGSTAGATYGVN